MHQTIPQVEDEFAEQGELTIIHLPTGGRYSTYAASNPDEFYVLCDRADGSAGLCARAKPILEEMLRRQRQLTLVAGQNSRSLFG
jgi:hypothetical protein